MNRQVELLAPAGSYQGFLAAIGAGADAVYVGGSMFGARAYAKNFTEEELLMAIDKAHLHGRKLYLTVNTLVKNRELKENLYAYIAPLYQAGLDGTIVQDYGVFSFLRRHFPDLPLHASTQMTVSGPYGMKFLEEEGASRVVPARELSLEEISAMHKASSLEIETFIHGALCYSYSGQCLMSSFLGGRSGNRGRCAQPCRLSYQTSPDRKSYDGKRDLCPLSLKDICTLDILPQILDAGVFSLKIEGRMKQPGYAAGVTSIYRKYVDLYLEKGSEGYQVEQRDKKYLLDLFNRGGSCTGYYQRMNGREMMAFTNEKKTGDVKPDIIEIKEKIYGNLILTPESPVILKVKGREKEAQAAVGEVQRAQKKPMEEERIRRQMEKLGNTPFLWEALDICLQGDVFVPVKDLNEARRQGLEKLAQEILKDHRREMFSEPVIWEEPRNKKSSCLPIYASCEDEKTAFALLETEGLDGLYLPFRVMEAVFEKASQKGVRLCLSLPHITRGQAPEGFWKQTKKWLQEGMEGLLVRNLESYAMADRENLSGQCILDHSMYTWNEEALSFWRKKGILRDTMPLELNEKELAHRDNRISEMVVYGYLPMMHSVQCVRKNLYGCDGMEKEAWIKDRLGKEFPSVCFCDPWKMGNTKRRQPCYNIIYNTLPYGLLNEKSQVEALGPALVRLSFTRESPAKAAKILDRFVSVYKKGGVPGKKEQTREFTKGHFKRGAQ